MKRYLILILYIVFSMSLYAQTAEEYLSSVVEKNKSYNDISIIFDYKFINKKLNINESIRGYASIKGNSYLLNIDAQEMICNGEILWTHLINEKEVMISEVTEDNNSSPLAIIDSFTGNVNVEIEKNNDANITTLIITEKVTGNFKKVFISVENIDLTLKKIHVFTTDDNEFIYEITDFKTNQGLPDSMFIFNETLHPNVEVIDMR